MSHPSAVTISRLMDNDCNLQQAQFALRGLNQAQQLTRWQRYHWISDTLRDDLPAQVSLDFSQRLKQRLDEMDADLVPTVTSPKGIKRWYRPISGFALAASVSAVTWVNLGNESLLGDEGGLPPVATSLQAATTTGLPSQHAAQNQQILHYLQAHQLTALHGQTGVLAYGRAAHQMASAEH